MSIVLLLASGALGQEALAQGPGTPAGTTPGTPLQSVRKAPLPPKWFCRSPENAAAIDAEIARLEKEIPSLKNRKEILENTWDRDLKRRDNLAKSLGMQDTRTQEAIRVATDDQRKVDLVRGDLGDAYTTLAELRLLPPCLEQKSGAVPQPPSPVPAPGTTPQPAPGGVEQTPLPPCRSDDNSAQIDARIAELTVKIANLLREFNNGFPGRNYKSFADAKRHLGDYYYARFDFGGVALEQELLALQALPPCKLYHVGGLRKPSTLYRSPSGFPLPGPPGSGTTPLTPAPAPGPSAEPKSVPGPAVPGAKPAEADERPEIGKAFEPAAPGFYVGFNAGGASGNSRWREPAPATSTDQFGLSGGLAGGTVGYQAPAGPLFFGVEADIAGGGISGDTTVGCFTPCRTSNSFLATVRGRAGFDLGPVMPFVSGGLAVGDVNAHVGAFPGSGTTRTGWTAGAGAQLPLTALAPSMPPGWVVKAEWLHVDLGSQHTCTPASCGGDANVSFRTEVFRVGINIPLSALIPR